jgi:DNA-directed RNA polymerase subunit RPC12/RpoP
MTVIEIEKFRCPKCKKEFEDTVRGHFPGKPCKECTNKIISINHAERQLIAQEFSAEQEDEKIVRQINDLLIKESSRFSENDEQLLTALAERLLKDEKRSKRIAKEILKLQKEKR